MPAIAESRMLPARYAIGRAREQDLARIAPIEVAAAALLAPFGPMGELVTSTSMDELRAASCSGYLWVARACDVAVAFALAQRIEAGALHLCELHVRPEHGRRGLGSRLVNAVCARATREGLRWVTLTTFRDVPWNMPFYARRGFECSARGILGEILEDEERRGLKGRVGMRRGCAWGPVSGA